MGVTTFIVSGWTFITNRIAESTSAHQLPCNSNFTHNATGSQLISSVFKTTVLRSCVVVVLISVLQMVSAAVVLGSAVQVGQKSKLMNKIIQTYFLNLSLLIIIMQGCRRRSQFWLGLNAGVNLMLLISLVVPMMYAEENKSRLHLWPQRQPPAPVSAPCDDNDGNGPQEVLHLASFYIALCLNFVIHFLTLVMSLMMLRYDENRDYELVALV
jgi:hypothetical protein